MGHNVGDQANRAVKKGEKKAAEALRTPAERLKDIRNSAAPGCVVAVTKDDVRFLLGAFDAEQEFSHKLAVENVDLKTLNASQSTMITELRDQIEQFRTVYEQENRSTTIKVERVLDPNAPVVS